MTHDAPAYGLWMLVILNSAVFLMFAFSFFKPQTARDWRTFGAFAAFIVALFVEMYGFPLSIYLMSGWLQTKYPSLDLLSHNSGHLWSTLLGEKGDPHFGALHIASYAFLGFGFYLLSSAWNVLYHAQRRNGLAKAGALCAHSPSAVRGLRSHFAGLPAAVADAAHAGDVPDPADHVCAARDHGRGGDAQAIRRRIRSLRSAHATLRAVILEGNVGRRRNVT